MKDIIEIQKHCETVEGFLSQNGKSLHEGEVLYHLARSTPKEGIIVEIGSWKGKSTIWLGKGSDAGPKSKIFAIDPHVGSPEQRVTGKEEIWTFPDFERNITKAKLGHLVCPLLKTSRDAAQEIDQPIDLLFIDGAHDEASVKQDFDLWTPKLKEGGIIAVHDSFLGWPEVRKVVHREIFHSPYFVRARYINSITYAIKTKNASVKEAVANALSFSIKITHEISLSLPQPFKSIIKRTFWRPIQKKWLKSLETT